MQMGIEGLTDPSMLMPHWQSVSAGPKARNPLWSFSTETFIMKSLPLPKVLWLQAKAGRHGFAASRTALLFQSGDFALALWADSGEVITDPHATSALGVTRIEQGADAVGRSKRYVKRIGHVGDPLRKEFTRCMVWRYR
jgi:hypothetical protein